MYIKWFVPTTLELLLLSTVILYTQPYQFKNGNLNNMLVVLLNNDISLSLKEKCTLCKFCERISKIEWQSKGNDSGFQNNIFKKDV